MTTTTSRAGVTHPRQATDPAVVAGVWAGAKRDYDLVKEFVIALVVVGLLTIGAAAIFSSPDEKSLSMAGWASTAPADFVATAASELAGTSASATYGPPYNDTSGTTQKIGPIDLQNAAGVRIPVDSANDFVIYPLSTLPTTPILTSALSAWKSATPAQQQAWATSFSDAVAKVPNADLTQIPTGNYGPVPVMVANLLAMARNGQLEPVIQSEGGFYNTDYTKSVLFLGDGTYLEDAAVAQHLGGDQWGMMNETGSYPGQSWMWLYTFWYQIEPFKSSGNADALVWGLMMILSLGFMLIPFIPGVRSIPRWIPIHRLIWRDYYHNRT